MKRRKRRRGKKEEEKLKATEDEEGGGERKRRLGQRTQQSQAAPEIPALQAAISSSVHRPLLSQRLQRKLN